MSQFTSISTDTLETVSGGTNRPAVSSGGVSGLGGLGLGLGGTAANSQLGIMMQTITSSLADLKNNNNNSFAQFMPFMMLAMMRKPSVVVPGPYYA